MELDPQSPAYRRQAFHVYYSLKKDVPKTVNELRKLFPDITFEEVDAWFARFKTGSKDIVTDVEFIKNARGLNDVPNPLKRKIMDGVGVEEGKALLTVSRAFRKIIETDRRLYNEVQMTLGTNYVVLYTENAKGEKKTVTYRRRDDGCEVDVEGETTHMATSYINEGLLSFNKKIEKIGTKIKSMNVFSRKPVDVDEDFHQFYSGIEEKLAGLKQKFHLEELQYTIGRKQDLPLILQGIKLGVLKKLELKTHEDGYVYDLTDIPSLPQHLGSLQYLWSASVTFNIPLDLLTSTPFLSVSVPTITPEEIVNIKNKHSLSPPIHYVSFLARFNSDQIKTALEPYESAADFGKYDGKYDAQKGYRICFKVNSSRIMFVRERK